MRTLLLLLLALPCWCVIADGDDRPHPSFKDLEEHYPSALHVSVAGMEEIAKGCGASLKKGYQLAAIQLPHQDIILSNDIPPKALMILLKGNRYTIAVYQLDQEAKLGQIEDCLNPPAVHDEDGLGVLLEHGLDLFQTIP